MQGIEAVNQYIEQAPEGQRLILQTLRELIGELVPQAEEQLKWSRPVYRTTKDFAYLKTAKAHVSLGFFEGDKLADPEQKLQGSGKAMCHYKIKSLADIDRDLLSAWLLAASI